MARGSSFLNRQPIKRRVEGKKSSWETRQKGSIRKKRGGRPREGPTQSDRGQERETRTIGGLMPISECKQGLREPPTREEKKRAVHEGCPGKKRVWKSQGYGGRGLRKIVHTWKRAEFG